MLKDDKSVEKHEEVEGKISIFEIIPEEIMLHNIYPYLSLKDLALLDSSVLCKMDREIMLKGFSHLIMKESGEFGYDRDHLLFNWLSKRLIRFHVLDVNVIGSAEELRKSVLFYCSSLGNTVTSLEMNKFGSMELNTNNDMKLVAVTLSFSSMIQVLRNLKTFKIEGNFRLSFDFIEILTSHCRQIEKIEIILYNFQISHAMAIQLYSAYTETLTELSLNFIVDIELLNDDVISRNALLECVSQHLVKLKKITLVWDCKECRNDELMDGEEEFWTTMFFPVDGFRSLIRKLHHLEVFDCEDQGYGFCGRPFLTPTIIDEISVNLPNLKSFPGFFGFIDRENYREEEIIASLTNLYQNCPRFGVEGNGYDLKLVFNLGSKLDTFILKNFSINSLEIIHGDVNNAILSIKENESLIKSLTKFEIEVGAHDKLVIGGVDILVEKFLNLKYLNLAHANLYPFVFSDHEALLQLEDVNLSNTNISFESVRSLLQSCSSSLNTLNIENCGKLSGNLNFDMTHFKLSSLLLSQINGETFKSILGSFPNLKTLTVTLILPPSPPGLSVGFEGLKNLELPHLKLRNLKVNDSFIDLISLKWIFYNAPSLEDLELSNSNLEFLDIKEKTSGLSVKPLHLLEIEPLLKIKKLDFSKSSLSPNVLSFFLNKCPDLKLLIIGDCPSLNYKTFADLAEEGKIFKSVKELEINGSTNFIDVLNRPFFPCLARLFPNLRSLGINPILMNHFTIKEACLTFNKLACFCIPERELGIGDFDLSEDEKDDILARFPNVFQ